MSEKDQNSWFTLTPFVFISKRITRGSLKACIKSTTVAININIPKVIFENIKDIKAIVMDIIATDHFQSLSFGKYK
jgi:hypothetical protein